MLKKKIFYFIPLLFLMLSCNSAEKKETAEIQQRLSNIEQLIEDNSLNAAKVELDSIHILFPRKVDARRVAKAWEDTIVRIENQRTLAYCDSLLPIRLHQQDSIQKNFRFEKNETYQSVGNYIYKTLPIEANYNRVYLRAYVDENADCFLVSNFTADYRLEHTSVKASMGDTYVSTDTIPLTDPFNHSFKEDGMYWEIVTFKNEAAGNVLAFINMYAKQRIKITLSGKRVYHYYLAENDKKALSETYALWQVKKDIKVLKKEWERAQAVIARINDRYSTPEITEVKE